MTFLQSILQLLKDIVIAFLEVNLSLLKDLKSFRNKLVVYTCLVVFLIIKEQTDYKVILSALGLLEIFLCYYFNNRKIKDPSIIKEVLKQDKK